MAYGIIRIDKVKAADIRGIENHDRRLGKSQTNDDIDYCKSSQNYTLRKPNNQLYSSAVDERIRALKLKKKPRANINVMLMAVVTSDNAFFDSKTSQEQQQFFQDSLTFLEDFYGKENIISATVHMDEETPHMHVNFVPVTSDGRLSAKEVYSPSECRRLQDEAFTRVFDTYGLERGEVGEIDEMTGYSKKKHKKTDKLKAETIARREEQVAKREKKAVEVFRRLEILEEQARSDRERLEAQRDELLEREESLCGREKCLEVESARQSNQHNILNVKRDSLQSWEDNLQAYQDKLRTETSTLVERESQLKEKEPEYNGLLEFAKRSKRKDGKSMYDIYQDSKSRTKRDLGLRAGKHKETQLEAMLRRSTSLQNYSENDNDGDELEM